MKRVLSVILTICIVLSMAVIPASAADLPAAPTNFKASPSGATSITLTWNAVSGADGYGIYRSTSKDGTYKAVKFVTGGSETSYKNATELTEGTTYYYKMRAYVLVDGDKKWGDYTAIVSAVPKVVLAKPTGLKTSSAGATKIALSWDAVSGADGYTLYRATSSSGTYTAIKHVVGESTTSYTNATGLETGRTYYYKVAAYTLEGTTRIYGAKSSAVSGKAVPAAPAGLKAESAGATSVNLTWSKAAGASGYGIYRATSKDGTYSLIKYIDSADTLSYKNASGLTEGKTYYYKMRSYVLVDGEKVFGSYSAAVSAVPKAPVVILAAPANFKAVPAGTTKITLSWSAVSGADGYMIYRSNTQSGEYTLIKNITDGSTSYLNATGLSAGNTYYYKIAAYKLSGSTKVLGNTSGIVSAKTPTTVPSSPSGFTAERASSTSVSLSWKKVANADGYAICRSNAPDGKYTTVKFIESPDTLSYKNVSGMEANGTYYFKIRAYVLIDGVKVYGSYSPVREVFLSGAFRIDASHFPDAVFREAILEGADTNGDGVLTIEEANNVGIISLSECGITSFKGIEYFPNLEYFSCWGNNLTSLDVSQNLNLKELDCSQNNIKNLDVSKNKLLIALACSETGISTLNVSLNTKLQYLDCSDNNLSVLNVSKNTLLEQLYCSGNSLTTLDVSKNTKLIVLSCSKNSLTKLNVAYNTNLEHLYCWRNKLSALDVSKNTKLIALDCSENNLTSLNVKYNVLLEYLDCESNKITKLDLSKNVNLTTLYCDDNVVFIN